MLRRVALVRIDVSEERIAFIIRVTRIGELGTSLAVASNQSTRMPSVMLRRVALVRADVSEERIASIIRMIRIGELRSSN
jgi:demethoxyubiquinone hydroxylase (CLK1/Coq7/Cat5 family)